MKLTTLHTYPIKGTRGLSHDEVDVELRGLKDDRRWMIVDDDNRFVTQREVAALATIAVDKTINGLSIALHNSSGPTDFQFDVVPPNGEVRADVQVWDDRVNAAIADDNANAAISTALDRRAKLAYMDEKAMRLANADYAGASKPVSFADGFPILLTTQASLKVLNAHIETSGAAPVPMQRFRPNAVVDGESAWDEDRWSVVQIGDVIFDVVKPCTRCVVTTRDQKTGIGSNDAQPIRALTQIRRSADKNIRGVLFGVNLVPRGEGSLAVGDEFHILERRAEPWPLSD
ncbi:MAG: MOSC N-terminal beta barrel domain-containing protein [Hyphomicrobiales bacterium]